LGTDRLASCGALTSTEFLTQTAIAWKLDVPIAEVGIRVATAPPAGIAVISPGAQLLAIIAIEREGNLQGTLEGWSAYEISCSGVAIAGVSGASR
jgi:hypothetical protein